MTRISKKISQFYLWFDMEYSTLELESAWPLQIAALITDTSLKRVLPEKDDIRLVIKLPNNKSLSPWVNQNLSKLVKQCHSSEAITVEDADECLAAYMEAAIGPAKNENQRLVLAGNSIHQDWWLACRFLPLSLSRIHYRHMDVSAFKFEWKRLHPDLKFEKENPKIILQYFPEAVLPASGNRHDAYYDLQASIAELAFYRTHLIRFSNCSNNV